jgi:hypothetical protein
MPDDADDNAIGMLESALEMCAKDYRLWEDIARHARALLLPRYRRTGRLELALEVGKGLLSDGGRVDDLIHYAAVLSASGQLNQSVQLFQRARLDIVAALKHGGSDGQLVWPEHFTEEEEERQAAKTYLELISADLIQALYSNGQHAQAMDECKQLIVAFAANPGLRFVCALSFDSLWYSRQNETGANELLAEADEHFAEGCRLVLAQRGPSKMSNQVVDSSSVALPFARTFHRAGREGFDGSWPGSEKVDEKVDEKADAGWGGAPPNKAAYGSGVDVCHIDRRDYRTLTAQQFHEEYVDQGKPLLLYGEGLLTERAREKWSREGLVREYGEEVVQVLPSSQYATEQSVQGRTFNYTELKLEEFVGLMEKWAIGMKPTLSLCLLPTITTSHTSSAECSWTAYVRTFAQELSTSSLLTATASLGARSCEHRTSSSGSAPRMLASCSTRTPTAGAWWSMVPSDGSCYLRSRTMVQQGHPPLSGFEGRTRA